MRGGVALAAALAIPLETDAGAPFPERDLVIFLAFCVILATLVGQGLLFPALIRLLGVEDDGLDADEELNARLEIAFAALDRIDELRGRGVGARRHRRARAQPVQLPPPALLVPARRARRPRRRPRGLRLRAARGHLPALHGRGDRRRARASCASCATRARSPTRCAAGSSTTSTSRRRGSVSRPGDARALAQTKAEQPHCRRSLGRLAATASSAASGSSRCSPAGTRCASCPGTSPTSARRSTGSSPSTTAPPTARPNIWRAASRGDRAAARAADTPHVGRARQPCPARRGGAADGAEWAMSIDADERVEREFRARAERVIRRGRLLGRTGFAVRIRDLWDSDESYRVDGIWNRKWPSRLFRLRPGVPVDQQPLRRAQGAARGRMGASHRPGRLPPEDGGGRGPGGPPRALRGARPGLELPAGGVCLHHRRERADAAADPGRRRFEH